jgi:predicted ATPase
MAVSDLTIPLPLRVQAGLSDTFVGRIAERVRLEDAMKSAVVGDRYSNLLSGEPGIGKTTLAAAFARDAYLQGAIVLYGRSDEDLGIPYQPWVEVFTHLVTHLDETVLVDHVARRGGRLSHLVPDLRTRVALPMEKPSADVDAERYLLFGDVVDVLARVSERAPIVLVLDDLHWADKPTLQLLRHIVASPGALHLLIIATYRDSEVGASHPLSETLAALHREHRVERLALHGLDDADLLALLEGIAGHEMDDDGVALRDAIARETDGNPFFVSEILRHLADTGAIRQDADGRWFASVDVASLG